MSFVEENIDRLIIQCKNGDESISFLAIFAFLEGWLRDKLNLPFGTYKKNNKKNGYVDFPYLIEELKEYEKGIGRLELVAPNGMSYRGLENELLPVLKKYHGIDEDKLNEIDTNVDTNRVRHSFGKIRGGSLFVVIEKFIEFATYHNFITSDIEELKKLDLVKNSRNQILLKPLKSSVLFLSKNDLFDKYSKLEKNKEKRREIKAEIDNINERLLNTENQNEIGNLITEEKQKYEIFNELDRILDKYSEYSNYVNELAITLIEARTKKDYETRIITLRQDQEDIVKIDLDRLANINDSFGNMGNKIKSMLIKGGPGTGKTLLLIASLFKLSTNDKECVLLTYYKELDKFINYLFGRYNQEALLNKLGIKKFSISEVNNFKEHKIKPFDDYILELIERSLNRENSSEDLKIHIYKTTNEVKKLYEIFESVVKDEKEAKKLYELATKRYWANNLTDETYLKESDSENSKKTIYLSQISEITKIIEDSKEYPDVYAYYKFFRTGFVRDRSITLPDYILIDEVQDLTNSQIAAASHLTKIGCILAGDMNQSIRNPYISWKELGLKVDSSTSKQLTYNYRSSAEIQKIGEDYQRYCKIREKNDLEAILPGPPAQLYLTKDTEEDGYKNTYEQIIISIRMCIHELCISPENICIVAFNEKELDVLQAKIKTELNLNARYVHDEDYSFEENEGVIRLSTARAIKGIDCAVLLFFISDQSKKENQDNIKDRNRGNVIYTVITRAMYLLQVFIPNYCKTKDYSVAGLVNVMKPDDKEILEYLGQFEKIEQNFTENIIKEQRKSKKVVIVHKKHIENSSKYKRKYRFVIDISPSQKGEIIGHIEKDGKSIKCCIPKKSIPNGKSVDDYHCGQYLDVTLVRNLQNKQTDEPYYELNFFTGSDGREQ